MGITTSPLQDEFKRLINGIAEVRILLKAPEGDLDEIDQKLKELIE